MQIKQFLSIYLPYLVLLRIPKCLPIYHVLLHMCCYRCRCFLFGEYGYMTPSTCSLVFSTSVRDVLIIWKGFLCKQFGKVKVVLNLPCFLISVIFKWQNLSFTYSIFITIPTICCMSFLMNQLSNVQDMYSENLVQCQRSSSNTIFIS